ncbi:hypothetical protein [Flyfo microvirus Tbat2_93]|nr:hypothetical protein [Flyfo microvirus Tbat2_93]
MTCQSPAPAWWQDYLAGRLTTPQEIYAASLAEHKGPADSTERAFFGDYDPGPGWTAPKSLQAPAHFKTNAWLRQCERANWALTDPRLMVWAAVFIHGAMKRNIPLYVHCALRDKKEQDAVRKAGNSKLSWPNGAHNIGEAVDIVHGTLHWDMNPQEWKLLSVLGQRALDLVNASLPKARKLELSWGGNWGFYDPAHWEIRDYKTRTRKVDAVPPVHRTPYSILMRRNDLLAQV